MKRIGLIDNMPGLQGLGQARNGRFSAAECFEAVGGNTGNIAYVEGFRRCVANPVVTIGWSTLRERVLDACDVIVVSCANQLGSHTDLGPWASKLGELGLPVVLVGLGAQADAVGEAVSLTPGTLAFVRKAADLNGGGAANYAVRGAFTASILAGMEVTSVPLGCPSLFISASRRLGADLAASPGRDVGGPFALASGNPYHLSTMPAERNLLGLLTRRGGIYVVQHPLGMFELALSGEEDTPARRLIRSRLTPDLSPEAFEVWREAHVRIHVDTGSWMSELARFRHVLGARFHGVALGVQAGVRGCVVVIDSRTEELATSAAIPTLTLDEAEHLADLSSIDVLWSPERGAAFDANRRDRARAMMAFLESQFLVPSAHLTSIADASS